MRSFKSITLCLALLLFILSPNAVNARNEMVSVELKGGKAKVALLKGSASVVKKGMAEPQPLDQDDMLAGGDRITTGSVALVRNKGAF